MVRVRRVTFIRMKSTKLQVPSTRETPMSKLQQPSHGRQEVRMFESLGLMLGISLELGAWNLEL
jgi:hypothetical protein